MSGFADDSTEAVVSGEVEAAPTGFKENLDVHSNYQPRHFIGRISEIVSKLPQGMQISRVRG